MTSFDGQNVGNTDVLVKYTFVGDADLSGTITAADYVLLDNSFNSQSGAHPLSGWRNGDFNYDNAVNGDDYTLIDNAFNTQGTTSFAGGSAGPAEIVASDSEQIAVPEPGSLGLVVAGGMLARRRRARA
jgi:Dockerin type I domain